MIISAKANFSSLISAKWEWIGSETAGIEARAENPGNFIRSADLEKFYFSGKYKHAY